MTVSNIKDYYERAYDITREEEQRHASQRDKSSQFELC